MLSMGAGAGCDAQYLFAEDVLGSNRGHMPRHSKVYRNFAAEYDRLQAERVAAFGEFVADVGERRLPRGAPPRCAWTRPSSSASCRGSTGNAASSGLTGEEAEDAGHPRPAAGVGGMGDPVHHRDFG